MRFLPLFFVILLIAAAGCQRSHTETAGGGEAKNQPAYEEKYQKPDPNLPGNR